MNTEPQTQQLTLLVVGLALLAGIIGAVAVTGTAVASGEFNEDEEFDSDTTITTPEGVFGDETDLIELNVEDSADQAIYEGTVIVDGIGEPGTELDVTARHDNSVTVFDVEGERAFITEWVRPNGDVEEPNSETIELVSDPRTQSVTLEVSDAVLEDQPLANLSNLQIDGDESPVERIEGTDGDITVDVENEGTGDADGSFDLDLTIENGDTITATESTSVLASGDSETVTFEDPISDLDQGEYDVTIEDSDERDSVTGTLEITNAEATITFDDQATASSSVFETGEPGVSVNVEANFDGFVAITYEDGGDDILVGGESFTAAELDGSPVSVEIEDTNGFPGDHTAHVVPTDQVSDATQNDDIISDETQDNIVAAADAAVLQGIVEFDDETYVDETDDLNITTADLFDGTGDDTEFAVVVHPFEDEEVGAAIGTSEILTGENSGVTVDLDLGEELGVEDDGDYIAMLHEVDAGSVEGPISHADADGEVDAGVTDDATVTVDQSATPEFDNLDIAGQGDDADVLETTNESVAADVTNIGDLAGSFTVELTIDNGQTVERSTETAELSADQTETVTFDEVTGDLAVGDYTVTIEDSEASDSVTGDLTISEARANVTLNEQATSSSTITSDDVTDPGVVVETDANVDADLFVTYEDNGDEIIAGLGTVSPDDETVAVALEDTDGFPGDHTAHTVLEADELSSEYAIGDTISDDTAAVIDDQNSSTIYESTVDFDDQSNIGPANDGDLTVNASLADGAGDDTRYVVDVHPTDDDGNLIADEFVGTTEVVTGTVTDQPLTLEDSNGDAVTIDETDDYVAMVHLVDDGTTEGEQESPGTFPLLNNADGETGFVNSGVTDSGEVTILTPATPEFENLDIAEQGDDATIVEGDDGNVTANVTNIGDVEGDFTVNLTIENGETLEQSRNVDELGADETETVEFGEVTSGLDADEYNVTVEDSENIDSVEGDLWVQTPPEANLANLNIAGQGDNAIIVEGDDDDVEIDVENIGEADGEFDVDLEIGDGDVESTETITVAGETTETLTFESVTDELAPGVYDVEVDTEDDAPVTGSLEVFAGIEDSSLADLDIAGEGIDTEIVEGDDENVAVNVTNEDDVTGAVSVNLEIGEDVAETERVTDLAPDETETVTFEDVTGDLEPGEYDVTVSTAHDTIEGDLTVLQEATGELSNLDIAGQGVDATVSEGENESVGVDLQNIGDLEGTFDVDLDIGDGEVQRDETITLDGAETETITFDEVTGDLDIDDYDVNVTTDDGAEISGTLSIVDTVQTDLSNLDIANQGADATLTEGTDADVEVSVENLGGTGAIETQLTIDSDDVLGDTVEETQTVTIDGGETEIVTFETVTGDLGVDDYDVDVTTEDSSLSGDLSVTEAATGGGGGGGGGGGAPARTTDDPADDEVDDEDPVDPVDEDDDVVGEDDDADDVEEPTDDDTPGFGVIASLVALTMAVAFLIRRN